VAAAGEVVAAAGEVESVAVDVACFAMLSGTAKPLTSMPTMLEIALIV
jgi:hypothetical protein